MLNRATHRAHKLGLDIDPATNHAALVRDIQRAEGKQPCFGTERRLGCRQECEWARECRGLIAEWLR